MDDLDERFAAVVEPVDDDVDLGLRTGNAHVDGVLDSLDGIDDLAVADHVAVFERAHEVLRSALDARPDDDRA